MQKWRRGGGVMPLTPKEFGMCIDDCIRLLRGLSDEQVNRILENEGRRNRGVHQTDI